MYTLNSIGEMTEPCGTPAGYEERMMTTFEVALPVDFSWIGNLESTAKKI
jgi:hypothetical protein